MTTWEMEYNNVIRIRERENLISLLKVPFGKQPILEVNLKDIVCQFEMQGLYNSLER